MVAQNTLREHEVNMSFPRKKNRIRRLFRCSLMPSTNRNTHLVPMCSPCFELPCNVSTIEILLIYCISYACLREANTKKYKKKTK